MTPDSSSDRDILGLRPLARAVEAATDATIAGAAAFFGRICLPAAEEFGLLLRDQVSAWRARNAAAIAERARKLLSPRGEPKSVAAHPRIVMQVIERGSWDEDGDIQDMWAGLLASSCTDAERPSDENIIFLDLLSRITSSEARLLREVCARAPKFFAAGGELIGDNALMDADDLSEVMGTADRSRQYRELAHLHSLELLKGGFRTSRQGVTLMPTQLGLHFVARCAGHPGDPAAYYGLAAV